MGNASAGHYVKMVHNGIEYGMMQLIAETYDLLKNGLGLGNDEISDIFTNGTKDVARSKGTGKWTSQDAMDLQVPVPTIDMAVIARDLSAYSNSRDKISSYNKKASIKDHDLEIKDVESALLSAFALTYIQGLHLIRVASRAYNYNTEMKDVVNNWREGCIIRSGLLENFEQVYLTDGFDGMILSDEEIYKLVAKHMPMLKK
nr:hypothetical protein [Candidatus Brachybacter algidus]